MDESQIAGWKLVPVEPTEKMQEAFREAAIVDWEACGIDNFRDAYSAMLAVAPAAPPAEAREAQDPLVRYCPGCGSIGAVEANYRDCCPDGAEARMIPAALAKKCQATHRVAVRAMLAQSANDASPPVAQEAEPVEHVAWVRYQHRHERPSTLHLCDSDAPGAFKVYAAPVASQVRPTDDELWDQTLRERDRYHDMADKLAERIAILVGAEIGEHSSVNSPWDNAIDAADDRILRASQVRAEPVPGADFTLSDEDMDAIIVAIKSLNRDEIGFHAFVDRIIAIAGLRGTAVNKLVDKLLANNREEGAAEIAGRRKDGASYGDSTLSGPVYTAPDLPRRCSGCGRNERYYEGCSHVVCPMRRSLTARPRDQDQP